MRADATPQSHDRRDLGQILAAGLHAVPARADNGLRPYAANAFAARVDGEPQSHARRRLQRDRSDGLTAPAGSFASLSLTTPPPSDSRASNDGDARFDLDALLASGFGEASRISVASLEARRWHTPRRRQPLAAWKMRSTASHRGRLQPVSYRCGPCGQSALQIEHTIELGPEDHSDEVMLQTMRCGSCGRGAIAVYEESRRGSDDRWHHDAWSASDDVIAMLVAQIAACPSPSSSSCRCPTHVALADRGYAHYLTGALFAVVRT
jgi:hypothetical protein